MVYFELYFGMAELLTTFIIAVIEYIRIKKVSALLDDCFSFLQRRRGFQ